MNILTVMSISASLTGGNHPVSQTTQQSLTRVDVALKMGHYEFGSARHTERRPNNLPFSNLTFREDDLNRLHSRASLIRADTGEGRDQPIAIRAVSREEVMRHNRPDSFLGYGDGLRAVSMSSLVSASERLLTAPLGERPERLLARRQKEVKELRGRHGQGSLPQSYGQIPRGPSLHDSRGDAGGDVVIVESLDSKGRRHVVGDNPRNHLASPQNDIDEQINTTMQRVDPEQNIGDDQDDQLNLDLREVNPEFIQGKSRNQEKQTVTVHSGIDQGPSLKAETYEVADLETSDRPQENVSKKSVVIRPASGSRRLFEKYSSGGSTGGELDVPTGSLMNFTRPSISSAKTATRATSAAKTMSARSRRVWSGRTIASSTTSGQVSRRYIPGPHDLATSARTVGGPNSSLSSLLDEPARPRPASRPSERHHRAAWYHVPGRYSTPQERYPRKRMQKTENARDIEAFVALKSQWAKRRQIELQQARLKGLQLEEEPGNPESDLFFASHTKQIPNRNRISSSKQKATSGSNSKFATRQSDPRSNLGPTRRFIHPDSTPRLMVSGLDIVPEQRYPDRSQVYYSNPQSQAVKFREPIVVG